MAIADIETGGQGHLTCKFELLYSVGCLLKQRRKTGEFGELDLQKQEVSRVNHICNSHLTPAKSHWQFNYLSSKNPGFPQQIKLEPEEKLK